MILISHLNFTTKRERIPYILAFFESCLLEYLKSQVDVDKSTETQGFNRFTIFRNDVKIISQKMLKNSKSRVYGIKLRKHKVD